MSEEQQVGEQEQPEPRTEGPAAGGKRTVTEEFKVAAEDLVEMINKLLHEGTVRRVTILRNDRVLIDIPLAVGAAASLVLAMQMPVISALAGLGMLLTGCTLRIEREVPPTES
ncbi:MAG: DUF4342 domain-containing protein [Anaerolineae bacterium]|jgi:hypothetical protein